MGGGIVAQPQGAVAGVGMVEGLDGTFRVVATGGVARLVLLPQAARRAADKSAATKSAVLRRVTGVACYATVWRRLLATTLVVTACSATHPSAAQRATQQHYVDDVHLNASDIGQYLTDSKLVKLGNAVCDGFRAKASIQQIADRMELSGGQNLPPQDLGALISAAVKELCPAYSGRLNPVSQ